MKKYIISLIVMAFAVAYAANSANNIPIDACTYSNCGIQQGGPKGKRGPKPDIEQMAKELSLSAEQKTQIQKVFEEMRPAKGETRPSREEMDAKRKAADAKIKKILNEEQYAKFEKMRANRKRPEGPVEMEKMEE